MLYPDETPTLPGVSWVVGNSHKTQIAELVTAAPYHGNILVGDIFAQHDFLSAPVEDAAGVGMLIGLAVSLLAVAIGTVTASATRLAASSAWGLDSVAHPSVWRRLYLCPCAVIA